MPQLEDKEWIDILTQGIKQVKSLGITSVQTDDLALIKDYEKLWEIYSKAIEQEPVRVYLHYNADKVEDVHRAAKIYNKIENTQYIKKGAIKIFLDGSLGAHTASLKKEYADCPNWKGVLTYKDTQIKRNSKSCNGL